MASAWKAERIRSASTTIFAEMSALALTTKSVNLGQGFPDTDGPAFMLEEARAAIAGGMNQYPPGRGILPLRQAIAAHSNRTYGLSYDPETEVLVTTGATEALAASIWAFVDPGDEVIALEPFYDSYAASIELAGGQRVGVGLFGPDFRLDHAELAAAAARPGPVADAWRRRPPAWRNDRAPCAPDRRAGARWRRRPGRSRSGSARGRPAPAW